MGAQLSITVLGSPAIALDGAPVRGFVSSKAAALAYYLAATGRAHSREALAGLLWGEVPDSQALKNLRDVLSNLRRLLEPYLVITRQSVAFAPEAAELVDSRRFEARLSAAERLAPAERFAALREADALFRGDFLDGFSIADAPAFEEWALVERERLRQRALDALHSRATLAAELAAYQEGIACATRLLAIDPTREEAHRQLMLLLALSGQRGAALAQYQACRRALSEDLGIEPDEATEALHRRILDGELVAAPAMAVQPIRPHYYLPAALTAFIGRADELAQVQTLLRDPACRLLTITGAGGAGKTRLALQAAHQLAEASRRGEVFTHGVVFVALAVVEPAVWSEPPPYSVLAASVADAMRFVFSGPETPHRQLADFLHEKNVLLVLDNCEHLPLAGFVIELLERAPRLTILATSRASLNLRGEQVIELSGLPFPRSRSGAPADWGSYAAVELFRDYAQAGSPQLRWTDASSAAAARICELVEGLPLGIELAASLVRLMPIEELAREIERSLGFLQSSRRDLPERHRSLRAVFDHSWKLLSVGEQEALKQLTVFRSGFSRAAAAQVAGASFALLSALVDNSLVRRAASHDQSSGRYELSESVRQYAAERLALQRTSDQQIAAFDRHSRYYLQLLGQRAADLRGPQQQSAVAEIRQEIENIRGAWRWALADGHVALIGQAAEGLFYFLEMSSWFQEGSEAFAAAAKRLSELHAADPSPLNQRVLGKLLARQGWLTFQIGRQHQGQALLEQSLDTLRPLHDPKELAFPLNYLAAATSQLGDYAAAERWAKQALDVSRAGGDQHGLAVAQTVLGQIAYLVGNYEDARRHSHDSLAIERTLGNRWGMVFTLINLGHVAQALREYHEAEQCFREGLAIRQTLGDARGIALCLNELGDTAAAQADHQQARRCYQQSLALFQEVGSQAGTAATLTKLGYNALALQEPAAADAAFHQALQIAWNAQATPRVLEALAGIATVLTAGWAEQAAELAEQVLRHPAATHESRDRAGAVLARLAPAAHPAHTTTRRQAELRPLAAVVTGLLA